MVFIFFVLGMLGILGGGLLALASMVVAFSNAGGDMRLLFSALVIVNLLPGLGIALVGLLLLAIGRALKLLRQIADNTYELQFALVPPASRNEAAPETRQRDFWR